MVAIVPHPPIIIPEIGQDRLNEARKTVEGMKKLGRQVREASPELLVFITPHGQARHEGPAVLTADSLEGDFGRFGFPGIRLLFETDQELVDLLKKEAAGEAIQPVFLENGGIFQGRQVLDHGMMVPLYYLKEEGLDLPGLHLTFGFNSLPQLYQFGHTLRRAVDKRGLPTAVIASGDLSHRLIPGAPAGYSPRGAEFDRLLVKLISEGRVEDILSLDPHLVEEAGECGLRSFVIALGMFGNEAFQSEIISYEGPFGVGYLVAALRARQVL